MTRLALFGGWIMRASRLRTAIFSLSVFTLILLFIEPPFLRTSPKTTVPVGPLTLKYVERGEGIGGRWYIPASWQHRSPTLKPLTAESSILEAAERALDLALQNNAFVENTKIPLILHQTWRTLETKKWPDIVRKSVEEWIAAAVAEYQPEHPEMAWFMWDDDGLDALIHKYESDIYEAYKLLPYPVTKADLFRIVVVKWFGGIYGDVDVELLKHPSIWVYKSDLEPWTETRKSVQHKPHVPKIPSWRIPPTAPKSYSSIFGPEAPKSFENIASEPTIMAVFGIECDSPPPPDNSYWRYGYSYPVQLTNWALAMAPHHPIASRFISNLATTIAQNITRLREIDPLDITGPPALTAAVQAIAQTEEPDLEWQSLSGLNGDPKGGRGKVVAGDSLVLPITGFSPGRGWFHNMGSESVKHRNARLRHAAAGSWRKMAFKVQYGKFCRSVFGMCRDWKKIP